MNFIKRLDFFGRKFSFTTFAKERYQTFIGFVFTVCMLAVGITFAIIFGSDFYHKTNPNIAYQSVIGFNYSKTNLTTSQFLVPWVITDADANYINFTGFLYPNVTYFSYDLIDGKYVVKKNITLNYTFCDSNTIKKIPSAFQYFCIDFDTLNLMFGGGWDGPFVDYFQITFSYCPDGGPFKNGKNCTTFNNLNEFLNKNIYFSIFYPLLHFKGSDVSDPFKIEYVNYYYQIGLGLNKIDRLYFQNSYLFDDQGWIIKDNKTYQTYYANSLKSDFSPFNLNLYNSTDYNTILYTFYFYLGKNYDLYTRSYMKFQNLAAIIGGFMNIIFIFSSIFVRFFNKPLRDRKLISKIFDFSKHSKTGNFIRYSSTLNPKVYEISKKIIHDENLSSKRLSLNQMKNIKHENTDKRLSLNEVSIFTNFNEKIQNIESKNRNNINDIPSTQIILRDLFCRKCIELKFHSILDSYQLGIEYLNNRLDVIHYLRTLDVIDRIRMIMFNQFQNLALDKMNKFNLVDSKGSIDIIKNFTQPDEYSNIRKICEYFYWKHVNNEMTEKDSQIYENLDSMIKEIIERKKADKVNKNKIIMGENSSEE